MGGALPIEERCSVGWIANGNRCGDEGVASPSLLVRLRFVSVSSQGGERRRMALPLQCMSGEEPSEEFCFSDDGLHDQNELFVTCGESRMLDASGEADCSMRAGCVDAHCSQCTCSVEFRILEQEQLAAWRSLQRGSGIALSRGVVEGSFSCIYQYSRSLLS